MTVNWRLAYRFRDDHWREWDELEPRERQRAEERYEANATATGKHRLKVELAQREV